MTEDPTPTSAPQPPEQPHGRAGRNLLAAVAMGLLLGVGFVLVPVLFLPWALTIVVSAAMAVGSWELAGALAGRGIHVTRWVLYVAAVGLPQVAYWWGLQPLLVAFAVTVLLIFGVRLPKGPDGYVADVSGSVLVVAYTAFMGSFACLLLAASQGGMRIIVVLALTVGSDVGGYVAGVLLGRHPMAPRISPKKSWEGFAGSVIFNAVIGSILVPWLLGGTWWQGLLTGLVLTVTATGGDLAESAIKRDLGVKDMSDLIPGHGGFMDRLDSVLPNLVAGWAMLRVFLGP